MNTNHHNDEITRYLSQTLKGYEVIPANFGWHIHKKGNYYGLLQFQEPRGWQGKAFDHLPSELKQELKKFSYFSLSGIRPVA